MLNKSTVVQLLITNVLIDSILFTILFVTGFLANSTFVMSKWSQTSSVAIAFTFATGAIITLICSLLIIGILRTFNE